MIFNLVDLPHSDLGMYPDCQPTSAVRSHQWCMLDRVVAGVSWKTILFMWNHRYAIICSTDTNAFLRYTVDLPYMSCIHQQNLLSTTFQYLTLFWLVWDWSRRNPVLTMPFKNIQWRYTYMSIWTTWLCTIGSIIIKTKLTSMAFYQTYQTTHWESLSPKMWATCQPIQPDQTMQLTLHWELL